ncbi:poly(A) RNA polymerase gld-2 homolog A-like [Tigriopus californicus]|uniref:poly(A) RNA polymerase gld-2 homolog A-like n=1 Tax=Tigriopus californicus TaxID=6832 RepID=UPI0027DA950F|nr:poly(A) RNA polymerase gld-2 homolog A-like [Tigriopus californicus]
MSQPGPSGPETWMKRRWHPTDEDPRVKRSREYQNDRGFRSDFHGPDHSAYGPQGPRRVLLYHPLQAESRFDLDPIVNNFMRGPPRHIRFDQPEPQLGWPNPMPYRPGVDLTGPPTNEHRVLQYLSLSTLFDKAIPPTTRKADAKANEKEASYEGLSEDMRVSFLEERQSSLVFERKVSLWQKMDDLVAKNFPGAFLQVFGSTLNGFGNKSSDMDLGIFVDLNRVSASFSQRQMNAGERIKILLHRLKRIIMVQMSTSIHSNIEMIPAKVPILKMREKNWNTEIDIACNHPIGVRNTHLLFHYCQLDWRIAPLVHTIKLWAKTNKVNEAKNGTFSSYSLSLMVLHVLQHVVQPPVIPSLQHLVPEAFDPNSDITSLNFERVLPQYASSNCQSLGALLVRFFQYYVQELDFTQHVPSVRTGGVLTNTDCEAQARRQGTPPRQWKAYICVEEPFERTNAARAICRREAFDDILNAMTRTWNTLASKSATATLASILGPTE